MSEPNFITVDPMDLTFKFELRKNIPVVMQLKNSTGDRIAFKVKTTSPKKYCVRPSSGIIEPHGLKEVQVIMQAQREPPASYSDCRDKFLVQCVKVGGTVKDVTSELFDPAKGSAIRQTKLRVILVPPALPPSPVPEGNESEPASPGSVRAPRFSPMETGFAEKRMQFQDQQYLVDRRLGSLEQPPRPVGKRSRQGGVTTPSRAGYGLLTVILVAFLAFIIGQISQGYLSQQLGTSDGLLFEFGAKLHKAVLEIMSKFQK